MLHLHYTSYFLLNRYTCRRMSRDRLHAQQIVNSNIGETEESDSISNYDDSGSEYEQPFSCSDGSLDYNVILDLDEDQNAVPSIKQLHNLPTVRK